MPLFAYKAKEGPAKTIEGELEADTRTAALARLETMGLSPIAVVEIERRRAEKEAHGIGPVRTRDITLFTRQLASLIRGGVPILRALSTVQEQAARPRFRKVVEDMKLAVRDGRMLSDALLAYPKLFPELYVNMVKAGEASGVLDTILYQMAEAREKDEETRRKVRVATAYPCLILIVGGITLFILLSFFLPKVTALFESYNRIQLPLPTRILMGISNWFGHFWPMILAGFLLVIVLLQRLTTIDKGRLVLDGVILRLPLIGDFILESDWARFSRTLALLLRTGVAVDKAIMLGANTMRNSVLRAEVSETARRTVQQGLTFSSGLKRAEHVPPFVGNMAAVGEETGKLDESLEEVAQYYERSLDERSGLMTALLEPLLILGVGGCVGFVVSAMLLPIFELSAHL